MCLLGPLNVFQFHKQLYIYIKVQTLRGDFWNLKSEFWSLKSKNPIQYGCQKTHEQNSNQSVTIKKTNKIQTGRQKTHKT